MEKKKIDDFIVMLSELSAFLVSIKLKNAELEQKAKISETVENYLDGFSILRAPMRNVNDAAQLNIGKRWEELGITEIFTKKEITQMPKLKELSYRYRKDNIHEFRYRRNGLEKSFASADFKVAKQKALQFCRELNANESAFGNKKYVLFEHFADNYLNNVKKVNVTEKTFTVLLNRYKVHILPVFAGKYIADIKAPFIQKFLNGVKEKGFHRTAEDCFYILKTIFQYAYDNDVITKNPVNLVKISMHQRQTGTAIPFEIEKDFIQKIAGHKYELNFLVLLYTGCRPCELSSMRFEKDGFITFQNRKQKNNKVAFKDIPITPMLAPYIERIKENLPLRENCALAKIFSKLTGYKMYSLRHTFATRCQTCGVPQEVVGRWLGHAGNVLTDTVYTHFPPAFMLEQAKKVAY